MCLRSTRARPVPARCCSIRRDASSRSRSASSPSTSRVPGWVEHDALEIWATQARHRHRGPRRARLTAADIAAIGITNQRETTVLWDRATGRPVAPAIVWQDRRTADACERLRSEGHEADVTRRTGLVLDPYFSATKLAWLLDSDPALRRRAERGELAFGTIDSWLIWNLTGGASHVTDITNASRTLLLDIASWKLGPASARAVPDPAGRAAARRDVRRCHAARSRHGSRVARSRSAGSPAISRRRYSARRALRRGWRRTPMAPAASC